MNNAVLALNESQKQWQKYRDSSCNYVYEVARSSQITGYAQDYKTNCVADFDMSREKILSRYLQLCEKSATGCSFN